MRMMRSVTPNHVTLWSDVIERARCFHLSFPGEGKEPGKPLGRTWDAPTLGEWVGARGVNTYTGEVTLVGIPPLNYYIAREGSRSRGRCVGASSPWLSEPGPIPTVGTPPLVSSRYCPVRWRPAGALLAGRLTFRNVGSAW